MKNPYICENNTANTALSCTQENKIDEKINKAAQNLPFVPENFNTANFLKGALIGAALAYILTNENAQQKIFKAVVKMGKLLQVGIEELKERFEDAKAEIESKE